MRTPRISLKLFRILGILVLILIVAHALLYQQMTRYNMTNQLFLRGTELAYPLWQKVNQVLELGGNSESLYGLSYSCSQIKKTSPDLREVAVVDEQGRILAHDQIKLVGTTVASTPRSSGEKMIFRETRRSLDTYLPVYHSDRLPIFVKISLSKRLMYQQIRRALMTSLIFGAIAISLFMVTLFFLTNSLLGMRITRLLEGFTDLSKGCLTVRLTNPGPTGSKPLRGRDELDLLMESFDTMANRLEKSDFKRRKQEQQLSYLATHDPLTGLPNRRLLEYEMKKVISQHQPAKWPAFLLMDLDNFKFVNDTMGHAAGDQVLIKLTAMIKDMTLGKDLLSRFGGDEFALLLTDCTDPGEAQCVAERICQAVAEYRFVFEKNSFHLGLSIGIVMIDGMNTDPGVILSQADTAMYSAKRQGRNRVQVYQPDDTMIRLSETSNWASQIKDALEEDRLQLFYQPVVHLTDSRIDHYEALVRLRNPNGDLIAPQVFIPAAEQFGLMPQLDRWVVKHVIRALQENPEIRIFMNLSSFGLADQSFLATIENALVDGGIEPKRLGFEITETALVQDLHRAQRWIESLKILGCRFALDDFGAGFNSFLYLRHLPIDQLKLDGLFIKNLGREPIQKPLVQAMHQLAGALGIETVAECVEDAESLEILKEIGVSFGQGFYLGVPVSVFDLNPLPKA
ncbi:MAG TPA: EAL domain-containing protein [Bacillota bacterium]